VIVERSSQIRLLRFRLRSLLLIVAVIAVVLAFRHELVASFYCFRISRASTSHDADHLADELWDQPGRKRKLRFAVRLTSRGSDKLDFAITEYLNWPHHNDVGYGGIELPPDYQDEHLARLDDYLAAVLDESRGRPELLDIFVHRERYYLSKVGLDAAQELKPEFLEFREFVGRDRDTELSWVLQFAVQCRLTGRSDLLADLTLENWECRARQWQGWLENRRDYLRFEPHLVQVVLDNNARASKTPAPAGAEYVTAVSTPLPGWTPSALWDSKGPLNCATCLELLAPHMPGIPKNR